MLQIKKGLTSFNTFRDFWGSWLLRVFSPAVRELRTFVISVAIVDEKNKTNIDNELLTFVVSTESIAIFMMSVLLGFSTCMGHVVKIPRR